MSDTATTATARKAVAKQDSTALKYSVANVRNGKGGMNDTDAVLSDLLTRKRSADRVVGEVMYDAALAAHRIVTMTKALKQGDYASRIGFSESYGNRLTRLGRAAVVHGVKPRTTLWTFLASNASHAEVGKAIAMEDTAQAVKRLQTLAAEHAEHGKISAGARVPTPEVTPGEDGDKVVTDPAPAPVAATLGDVLDALDRMVKAADREAWAATENRLQAIITRENVLRSKVDSTVPGEVVATATPATVAKAARKVAASA